ncbi:MAG: radical SAM protein [Candidatus Omnitrophica bacterium]|nr:radical SAM protein [Candidatus Omnitrophota bacterium]
MKRVDIKIGFNCNNHCRFCVQGNKRTLYSSKTTEEIKKILQETRRDWDSVVFTGGEPSIREDIIDLVSYAKRLKFETIQIQTNGRMFCYKQFCNEIISAGANEFSPAVHGHTAELHDYLTCSEGSFQQTLSGIKNLKEYGQRIITNTVVTKSNYRHLPQIAQLLLDLGVNQFQFAFVHALGSAKENFASVVPRMSLVEPYAKEGLDIGIKAGISVMTEAIPYCFMRGFEKYIAENIIPSTKIYDANSIIDDFTETRQKESKAKGPLCKTCRYYNVCEGPWKEYPEKFGWKEFCPV